MPKPRGCDRTCPADRVPIELYTAHHSQYSTWSSGRQVTIDARRRRAACCAELAAWSNNRRVWSGHVHCMQTLERHQHNDLRIAQLTLHCQLPASWQRLHTLFTLAANHHFMLRQLGRLARLPTVRGSKHSTVTCVAALRGPTDFAIRCFT